MRKVSFLILIIFGALVTSGWSQNREIDSLKSLLNSEAHDTIKALVYSDLCYYYRFVSTDSAIFFGENALKYSIDSKYKKGEAQAYNDLGIIYSDTDEGEKAIEFYNKSMIIRLPLGDSTGVAGLYLKIGIVHQKNGRTEEAIKNQQNALKIYEAINNLYGASYAYNNIAILHYNQGMHELALEYYKKSLDIKLKLNDNEGIGGTLANIGNIYFEKANIKEAKKYYSDALNYLTHSSNKSYVASIYNNLSSIYSKMELYDSALYYCDQSIVIRKHLSDRKGLASSFGNRGSINIESKNYSMALIDLKMAMDIANEIKALPELYKIYLSFSIVYDSLNNQELAYQFLHKYSALKDTIENENIALKVSELQTKYETEKKEQQIKIQELAIAEQEAELKKNRIQVASSVGGIIVLIVVLALLYNAKRLREQVLALETVHKLQSERERISSDLHDHVGAQLTSIISGLQMTETVGGDNQSAQFKQLVESLKEDAQVTITHLRDTIWTLKEEEITPSEFGEHIHKFAESALRYREKPTFNIYNTASDGIKLNPTVALNLTRVVEEAIHNAIKHSDANYLTISLTSLNHSFTIEVKDDGKGFDLTTKMAGEHYGLDNMKRRMEDAGGKILFNSSIGQGATILIECKV